MNDLGLSPSELFLLVLVLKGAVLMTMAFALAFLLRWASAAIRHAMWSLAFVGLLLMPICAAFLPAWQIAVPGFSAVEALLPKWTGSFPFETTLPVFDPEVPAEAAAPVVPAPHVAPVEPFASATPLDVDADGERAPSAPAAPGRQAAWSWTSIALLLWMGGALVLLIRLALVLNNLSLLSRRAEPVTDPEWTELAEVLAEVLDIRRPVRLLRQEEIAVPVTYGVRRPVILLPGHADEWSEEQKHMTLMHELLHIQRYDYLVHVLALSARALHWFNPLTWAAAKRLLIERERSCDDGVLAMGIVSTSYADYLLGMARHVLIGQETSAAALAMVRPSELRSRIVAILDRGQRRRPLTRLHAFGMAGCALVLVVPLAAMQPGGGTVQNGSSGVYVETAGPALEPDGSMHAAFGGTAMAESIGARHPERTGLGEGLDALYALDATRTHANVLAETQLVDTSDLEMQRRALHALSELPRERSIPLLTEIAQTHRNPALRAEALFWLGEVGDASVADLLETFARNDASQTVQQKAIFALSELEDAAGIPRLMGLARTHRDPEMRAEAVFWLGEEGGVDVADALEAFARSDASTAVQKKAVFALAELEEGAGIPRLIDLARSHPDPEVRSEAIFWLGESGDPRAADILLGIVNGR